jgi:hypothetical protein
MRCQRRPNLLRQINEPAKTQIAIAFRELIKKTNEIYVTSADASSRSEFLRIGLSDSALLEVSKKNIVILSVDLERYLAALTAGYEAVNFNHLRDRCTSKSLHQSRLRPQLRQ